MRSLQYSVLCFVFAAGCGRIGFAPRVDATLDASADAIVDASADGVVGVRTGLVLELAFEGSATDDGSGGGHDARCTGGGCPVLEPAGVVGGALGFAGTGEYLVVDDDGSFDLSAGFTVGLWVRLDEASGRTCFFTKPLGGGSDNSFAFCADSNTPFLYVCGATCDFLPSGEPVPLGTWFHLAAIHDGATRRFFVDGVEVATRDGAVTFDTDPLVVGGDVDGTFDFAMIGAVDEVRMYDRPLTTAEIGRLAARP